MSRHLLVVGAQRCGTTYLSTALDAHPRITMARPARPEPKVFLSDELADRGAEWYRRTYFAHATDERLLGEKSTSYIEDPQAPGRVSRVLGSGTEIVAILRDPVQRAVSNWRFSSDNGYEHRPLEAALRENLAGTSPVVDGSTSVSPYAYLERGRYADHLGPWFSSFPATTHILFLSEVMAGAAPLVELYKRIGVDAAPQPVGAGEVVNASHEPAPALPADLIGDLRGYFADSDRALSDRIGRALPWQEGGTDEH